MMIITIAFFDRFSAFSAMVLFCFVLFYLSLQRTIIFNRTRVHQKSGSWISEVGGITQHGPAQERRF
jgi:hypothetical protein